MDDDELRAYLRGLQEEIDDLRDVSAAATRSATERGGQDPLPPPGRQRLGKLAIVVGHTAERPGASAGAPIHQSEHPWNRDLADRIVAAAGRRSVTARVFLRDGVGIAGAYRQVENWGADAAVELHFNSASATARGTETLHGNTFAPSATWAAAVQGKMVRLYGRQGSQDRGLRAAPPWPRGRSSVNALRSIASCLIEPFFGSNSDDARLGHRLKSELAEALVDAFAEFRSSGTERGFTRGGTGVADGGGPLLAYPPSRIDIHRARQRAATTHGPGTLARGGLGSGKTSTPSGCREGWYITGYYTPVESDFSGSTGEVEVSGHGPERFPATFIDAVALEGWGRTRLGWCLGRYGGRWHRNESPLDARGQALDTGAIAVDPDLIAFGSRVTIPTLPPPLGSQTFIARDVGSAIRAEHIDVYCGEGNAARLLTHAITGHHHRVCL